MPNKAFTQTGEKNIRAGDASLKNQSAAVLKNLTQTLLYHQRKLSPSQNKTFFQLFPTTISFTHLPKVTPKPSILFPNLIHNDDNNRKGKTIASPNLGGRREKL